MSLTVDWIKFDKGDGGGLEIIIPADWDVEPEQGDVAQRMVIVAAEVDCVFRRRRAK